MVTNTYNHWYNPLYNGHQYGHPNTYPTFIVKIKYPWIIHCIGLLKHHLSINGLATLSIAQKTIDV